MGNIKSPYRSAGLNVYDVVHGRGKKKRKPAKSNSMASGKEISKVRLRGFGKYAVKFKD